MAGLGNTGHGNITPSSSPIPWRKAGLRYNNNEIYFDVTEELKAVVGPSVHRTSLIATTGTDLESMAQNGTLSCDVFGKIDSNSNLSGNAPLTSLPRYSRPSADVHELGFSRQSVILFLCEVGEVSARIKQTRSLCSCRPQRWKRDKALSFVLPDGGFNLTEY